MTEAELALVKSEEDRERAEEMGRELRESLSQLKDLTHEYARLNGHMIEPEPVKTT